MKRTIKLALSLALIFALLAGCGSGTAGNSAVSSADESVSAMETTEAPVQDESSATEPEQEEPASEAETAGVGIAGEQTAEENDLLDEEGMMNPTEMGVEYIYPVDNEPKVTIANSLHTNLTDITEIGQFAYMDYVQAETGYTVEWTTIEQGSWSDQLNIMLATGDYPNMIMNFSDASYSLASALEEEIIVDLTDRMEEYSPNYYALLHAEGNEDFLRDCSDDNGNFLCYWMLQNTAVTNEGYWVRTDMLEAAGINEIPATYDQWEEAMLAVKETGKYDLKTGLLVNSESFCQYFSYGYDIPANRTTSGLYHVDGEVRSCYTEDAFREYLSMMSRWYDEGLLYSDFVSMDSNPMSSEVTSMITQDQAIIYSAWNNSADGYKSQANNADFAVQGIPEPMKEAGQTGHFNNASRVNNMHNLVITNTANVEECMIFCDWWYSGEGIDLYNYGEEGVVWNENEQGEREYTELVTNDADGYAIETAWGRYAVYGNFIGYSNEWRSNWYFEGEELASMQTWTNAMDNAYSLPTSFMSLTTDETSEISNPTSDIDTYIDTELAMMVIGEKDVNDDAVWNEFVDTVESLGLQTIVDTYQDSYDRYLARS